MLTGKVYFIGLNATLILSCSFQNTLCGYARDQRSLKWRGICLCPVQTAWPLKRLWSNISSFFLCAPKANPGQGGFEGTQEKQSQSKHQQGKRRGEEETEIAVEICQVQRRPYLTYSISYNTEHIFSETSKKSPSDPVRCYVCIYSIFLLGILYSAFEL